MTPMPLSRRRNPCAHQQFGVALSHSSHSRVSICPLRLQACATYRAHKAPLNAAGGRKLEQPAFSGWSATAHGCSEDNAENKVVCSKQGAPRTGCFRLVSNLKPIEKSCQTNTLQRTLHTILGSMLSMPTGMVLMLRIVRYGVGVRAKSSYFYNHRANL